jgi:Bacterial HORMA domain 2
MSTFVTTSTYTHSVTYVTGSILRCLQDIVRDCGLSPGKLAGQWTVLEEGLSTWLASQHLEAVRLEVFDSKTNGFVGGWELAIAYSWKEGGGTFWVDTEQIRYAILKQGFWPSDCDYDVIVSTKPGRPDVAGWTLRAFRSTDGFVRQSLGTTMDASGLSARASYFRKV